jgi:hypothetical protein
MAEGTISDEELTELVQRTEEATSAFTRGDMDRYLALTPHARGFTLMNPFGGPPARYEDRSESLRAAASYFKAGEAKHADPLVHAVGLEQAAVLPRGGRPAEADRGGR